ncbi:hypothetical protein ONZ51_g7264 [Trametes cubensis]|uniref:Uncharacterized protein n=1 Tax=Trametes cubensis TaxID=1111947 RepID=A0AAD7X9B4_9APHY|nr:hypothetical protein ONZ51_g7264 [Trametes cubensis]
MGSLRSPPAGLSALRVRPASHRAHLSQPQDVSYYGQYQPRQSSNSALAAAAPGSSLVHSQPSSHRHSIAHISNPVRQHSPTGTSTQSASPAVSHPPTPAAYGGYVSSMGSYAESPPSSVSPVAPSSQLPSGLVTAYGSYESSSLASAGYTHPPSQPPSSLAQPQTQPQAYDRTLPSLSPTHARDSQPQQSVLHMSFNYAQASYHPSGPRHASPPPVLAPIQESRILRRDPTGTSDTGMRYASPPQVMHSQTQAQAQPPPMQSLASVSRSSGHAFSYPLSSQHPHSHMHSPTAYPQAPGPSAYAAGSTSGSASAAPQAPPGHAHTHAHSGGNPSAVASSSSAPYYYQHAYASPVHPHREASPEPVDGVNGAVPEQYLELHQPQPQRLVTGHGQSHGHAHGHAHASAGHQYLQTGAVLNASSGGGGGSGHPGQTHAGATWRTDDYRGRGGLGGLVQ